MTLAVRSGVLILLSALLALGGGSLHGQTPGLPDPNDPVSGMGVNIHFTDAKPGELEMISKAGFRWVRMDLFWADTEKKLGVYDFSAYDRLMTSLDRFHIRALLILDYGNLLYDQGAPPRTEETRAAFARWAAAAVTHFKGRGALWEIWNEPNGDWFWKPHANVEDYAKLALAASKAIHETAPDELIVGPALSSIHLEFVDTLGREGVLRDWAALTIHPYLHTGPETYGPVYRAAQKLIDQYTPANQHMKIICGESGYCTIWDGLNETLQAQYLPRLFLFNAISGVPVTIWYDWRDDGANPADQENQYGIVHHDYLEGATPVYQPKPAYEAARTFSTALTGYRFQQRIKTDSPDDYVLSFTKDHAQCLVTWTTSITPHKVKISAPDGIYIVTSFDGKSRTEVASIDGLLILPIDGGPQYLKRN